MAALINVCRLVIQRTTYVRMYGQLCSYCVTYMHQWKCLILSSMDWNQRMPNSAWV